VEGWVDLALAGTDALVSVQAQGVPIKTGVVDGQGRFVLFPVPAGTYDLVVTAPGRVTSVVTGVPVTNTGVTAVASTSLRISPPLTFMRTVNGTVSPATASVRAVQSLSGGPFIEVASPPVDAQGGNFVMNLPISAPVRAPYAANAPSLAFTADSAVAGLYAVQATSDGSIRSAAIDTANVVAPLSFIFP
jgi:hypothetical protein